VSTQVSTQENRDALERFVRAFHQRAANTIAELVHDDVVEEYPQAGERIRDKQNYLSVFENIPLMPNVIETTALGSAETSPSLRGPLSMTATAPITPP
jgi:hypothetical protein